MISALNSSMAKFQHWRSLLREPVVQFLLIGSSLFVVHTALRPSQQQASSEIVITDDQAAALFSQFSSTWQRAPSKQELQSLIDDEVRTGHAADKAPDANGTQTPCRHAPSRRRQLPHFFPGEQNHQSLSQRSGGSSKGKMSTKS